jgi:hypothetical protein
MKRIRQTASKLNAGFCLAVLSGFGAERSAGHMSLPDCKTSPTKYFQVFLPGLCQNRIFVTSNNRGGKSPYRATRPPPFLG